MTERLELGSVTIEADNVTIIGRKAELSTKEKCAYRLNAALFALTMALLTVWFMVHLQTYVTEVAVVGAVTLLAVTQAAVSWFTDLAGKPDDIRRQWLSKKALLPHLIVWICVAVALLLLTKTVYAKYGKSEERLHVELRDAGNHVIRNLRLDEDHPADWALLIPQFRRQRLKLVVTEPPGYAECAAELNLLGTASVTIPCTHFHLLRLVAPIGNSSWPNCDEADRASVIVTAGKHEYRLKDGFCRQNVLYIGASRENLIKMIKVHDAEFEKEYRDRLGLARMGGDAANEAVSLVKKYTGVIPTDEWSPGTPVRIQVQYGNAKASIRSRVGDAEVETVLVEEGR